MKIAFVLFDQMTTLDFVGFYDAVTRLKIMNLMEDVSWELCALTDRVTDELGVTIEVPQIAPDLSAYDMIFVPGGRGTRTLRHDPKMIDWLRSATGVQYKIGVCTGALLLGAAGFLEGRRATTNPPAYELLEPYCAEVVRARIVQDGNVITGGGVATSIDLGLYVLEMLSDAESVQQIAQSMDYPYYQAGRMGLDYTV